MIKEIVTLCRPQHWIKNMFVFLPLFFHGDVFNVVILYKTITIFFCFSLMASSIYCFNDIFDVKADRLHPIKCKRPIAAGTVSIHVAYGLMVVLFSLSLGIAILSFGHNSISIISILCCYFVMNIAYCIKLKQIALIDIFIISIGFVLRVVIGGLVGSIELSSWIVLMTFLLALFLAFAKRRDDVVLYQETGVLPRKNVNRYNLDFMNQAITIVATVTLVSYIMYSVSDEVMEKFSSRHIYYTAIFVLAGILRYMQRTIVDVKSGSPTKLLLKDRFLQCCIVGWILSFLVIIYC